VQAVETIRAEIQRRAGAAPVAVGLVLGSGLGHLTEAVDGVAIDYADLPGFPHAGVSGHQPRLVVGELEGTPVAVLGGRAHYYESGDAAVMRRPLEVLRALGAGTLILTNAAGSFRADIPPGELMLIADHINFSGRNPLIGEPTDARFVNLTDAYDPGLRRALAAAAAAEGVALKEGVYAWYSGPSFETPAEIRALKILGADAVGMSTVPEVILARFLGMRVAAISAVTNMAAGHSDEAISHDHTKAMAPLGAQKLERVLRRYLAASAR
jgi:purine-nucleoside phosphorylase